MDLQGRDEGSPVVSVGPEGRFLEPGEHGGTSIATDPSDRDLEYFELSVADS